MALPVSLLAQKVVDQWRYTLEPPQGAWQAAAYDDAAWKQGNGGFGTVSTPGARVGTVWRTKTIWLRKRVPLAGTLKKPALLVHHDEDAEFFLNGQRVLALKGYLTDYKVVPLADLEGRIEEPGTAPAERDLQGPLEEAIRALAPRLRTVFVLHDVQGFRHEEIARTIGCAVGTSKSQLFKARLKVRAHLRARQAV